MYKCISALAICLVVVSQALAAQWLAAEKYGNGSAGAISYGSSQTHDPTRTSFAGSTGTNTGTVGSNFGLAVNDLVLLHQSRNGGSGAGKWELNRISAIAGTTITFAYNLDFNYGTTAQLIQLIQYSTITVNSGVTLSAPNWDGSTGGIVALLARNSITVTGTISASSAGYHSSGNTTWAGQAYAGEGTAGPALAQQAANGNGGGGGQSNGNAWEASGGGGGGHAANGSNGNNGTGGTGAPAGYGGTAVGDQGLTTVAFGGSGGQGGRFLPNSPSGTGGYNGSGGGIVLLIAPSITVTGAIVAHGQNGGNASGAASGGGGGGAGGAILLKGDTLSLGSNLIQALGGAGGAQTSNGGAGGAGSVGRIHADYATSISGATNPTIHITQDANLIPNATPTAFSLIAPSNSTSTANNRPAFTWGSSSDPEGQRIAFTLKISKDAQFTEPVYRSVSGLSSSSYTPMPGQEIATGSYYWKVIASDGETSTTSNQVWQLTLTTVAPSTPIVTGVLSDALTGQIIRIMGSADSSEGRVVDLMVLDSNSGLYLSTNGTANWDGDSFTFTPSSALDSGANLYFKVGDGSTYDQTDTGVIDFAYVRNVFQDSTIAHQGSQSVRLEQDTAYAFKLAVNAGSPVTVTAWLRKNGSYTGTAPSITLTGLGIAGTGGATASLTAAADTWQQVTVTGTPNADGVLTLTFETFSTAAGSAAWIDDIVVSQ